MAYNTTDLYGVTELNPTEARLEVLLQQLQEADEVEHPDVSLIHESGWSLSAYPNGTLLWENLEMPETEKPRYLSAVPVEKVLEYWLCLARGQLSVLHALPWQQDP